MAERAPGGGEAHSMSQGQAPAPTHDIRVSLIHTLLGCAGDPHRACQNMPDSPPPACGVLVLISFSHEGRGEAV